MKMWKKKEGVSPVIAVILMVAITVVLAAVLYVMVSGMMPRTTTAPHVTFATPSKQNSTIYYIDVAGVDRSESYTGYKAVLLVNGTSAITLSLSGTAPISGSGSGSYSYLTLKYSDVDGGTKLSGGDRFTVDGGAVALSGNIELKLFWTSTGDEVGKTSWTAA